MISSHKIHLTLFFTLILGCNLLHSMETKTQHAATQESQQAVIPPWSKKRMLLKRAVMYKQEATLDAICLEYKEQLRASDKDAHTKALERLKKVHEKQELCNISSDWKSWTQWNRSYIECIPFADYSKESSEELQKMNMEIQDAVQIHFFNKEGGSKKYGDLVAEFEKVDDKNTEKGMAQIQRYMQDSLNPSFSQEFCEEFKKVVAELCAGHIVCRWKAKELSQSTSKVGSWKGKYSQFTLREERAKLLTHFNDQEKIKIAAMADDENEYDIIDGTDADQAKRATKVIIAKQ